MAYLSADLICGNKVPSTSLKVLYSAFYEDRKAGTRTPYQLISKPLSAQPRISDGDATGSRGPRAKTQQKLRMEISRIIITKGDQCNRSRALDFTVAHGDWHVALRITTRIPRQSVASVAPVALPHHYRSSCQIHFILRK